jgi:hypothetical protein
MCRFRYSEQAREEWRKWMAPRISIGDTAHSRCLFRPCQNPQYRHRPTKRTPSGRSITSQVRQIRTRTSTELLFSHMLHLSSASNYSRCCSRNQNRNQNRNYNHNHKHNRKHNRKHNHNCIYSSSNNSNSNNVNSSSSSSSSSSSYPRCKHPRPSTKVPPCNRRLHIHGHTPRL